MTDFPANSLQFLKETIELLLSDPKQQQTKRPHVFSSLLSFLISKSLMDCSLMIRFEKESHLDNRPVKGTSWFYSLIVVDVEPKAVTKIPSYFAHDVEIQEFTASHPEFKACVT